MKKFLWPVLGLILLASCTKEGSISGDWQLASGAGKETSGSSSSSWSYTSPTLTKTSGNISKTSELVSVYKLNKDGKYAITETVTSTNFIEETTTEGIWYLAGGRGDVKRKSQLVMILRSRSKSTTIGSQSTTDTETYEGNGAPLKIYNIEDMSGSELVLKYSGSETIDGITYTTEEELKLKP